MLKPEEPYTIVTIVTPETDDPATSGCVVNLPCAPTVTHESLMRDRGQYYLRPGHVDAGYRLLKDLYVAEDNAAGWADYQAHVAAFQAGRRVGRFPLAKLPREVRRRQGAGVEGETEEPKRRKP